MLESVLIAGATALAVSVIAVFLMEWGTRLRLRRLQHDVNDVLVILERETKRRAAAASVESRRTKAQDFDAAIVAQHTAHGAHGPAEDEPWWSTLIGRGRGQ